MEPDPFVEPEPMEPEPMEPDPFVEPEPMEPEPMEPDPVVEPEPMEPDPFVELVGAGLVGLGEEPVAAPLVASPTTLTVILTVGPAAVWSALRSDASIVWIPGDSVSTGIELPYTNVYSVSQLAPSKHRCTW